MSVVALPRRGEVFPGALIGIASCLHPTTERSAQSSATPASFSSSSSPSEYSRPEPFQPTGRFPISATVDPNAIFGQNELEAAAFFNDMINLTRLRDEILNTATFIHQPPDSVAVLLRSTLRDTTQGHFSPYVHGPPPRQRQRPRPLQRHPSDRLEALSAQIAADAVLSAPRCSLSSRRAQMARRCVCGCSCAMPSRCR